MDDLERMIQEAEKYNKQNLEKKKIELEREVDNYEFRTLLDAANFLFELRAKRNKEQKDKELIRIIEGILAEEPFEYYDEDFILIAYKDHFDKEKRFTRIKKW